MRTYTRYLIAALSTALIVASCSKLAHSAAVIFSGPNVKSFRQNLDLNGVATLMSGSVDPTSSAQSAPEGSLYLSTNGSSYVKQDAGSSTNWVRHVGTADATSADTASKIAQRDLSGGAGFATVYAAGSTVFDLGGLAGYDGAMHQLFNWGTASSTFSVLSESGTAAAQAYGDFVFSGQPSVGDYLCIPSFHIPSGGTEASCANGRGIQFNSTASNPGTNPPVAQIGATLAVTLSNLASTYTAMAAGSADGVYTVVGGNTFRVKAGSNFPGAAGNGATVLAFSSSVITLAHVDGSNQLEGGANAGAFTGNLMDWRNSTGLTTYASIDGTGNLTVPSVKVPNGQKFTGAPSVFLSAAYNSLLSSDLVGAGKAPRAMTVENVEGVASTFTCSTNPTVTLYECGTSATCAAPTAIGSVTVSAANTITDGTVSAGAIAAGHYYAFEITAGACTTLTLTVSAEAAMQ